MLDLIVCSLSVPHRYRNQFLYKQPRSHWKPSVWITRSRIICTAIFNVGQFSVIAAVEKKKTWRAHSYSGKLLTTSLSLHAVFHIITPNQTFPFRRELLYFLRLILQQMTLSP